MFKLKIYKRLFNLRIKKIYNYKKLSLHNGGIQ